MTDQGGTAKFRERFTGGGAVWPERLYGSLKAVDPVTGEIKATAKLPTPTSPARWRRLATLCSSATWTAPSRRTTPRPSKQYVAVLVGARQPTNILQNLPELRNTSTASMLYVFSL